MDPVNQKILELIRNNARMSYSDIGKSVGISRVSVKDRIDMMEKSGTIRGYRTVIDDDSRKEGILYTLDIEAVPEEYAEVVRTLRADKELKRIYSTTGECRIHCVGVSLNQETSKAHVKYLFNHLKGIRRMSWNYLISDLRQAEEGVGDGTEDDQLYGI